MTDGPTRLRDRYSRWTEPSTAGLPRWRVLLAFPALLLIGGVVLIALSLNGTSSGMLFSQVSTGTDPDLIAGHPQAIRSDEWNVQTVWAITQVQQGLPETNRTFPDGGMDATVPQDLPRVDWSVAFRPHLIGFMVLPLDNAMAWKWWVPGLAVMGFAYAAFLSLMPRRPGASALLSIGFFFSPLLQWWYLNTTLWPVAWGFAVIAALVWAARDPRRWTRWIWAAIAGYLTVVMAMGIYVPFIVPVVLVVLFFAIGVVVEHWNRPSWFRDLVGRYGPLLVGGAAGGVVTAVWLATRLPVVDAFLSTDYPGERLWRAGDTDTPFAVQTIASAFTQALKRGGLAGLNPSEASSFFFLGIFLLPAVVGAAFWWRRSGRRLPWMLIGVLFAIAVTALFLLVPGWDAIAHLLFLDRSVPNRLRLGLGFASILIVPLFVAMMDGLKRRTGWTLTGVVAALYVASQVGVAWWLHQRSPGDLANAPWWIAFAVIGAVSLVLLARRWVFAGALVFALLCVVQSGTVNPVYRGVFDLRGTALSKAIQSLDATDPGVWVGVGGNLSTAALLESGVTAYNGFQGAPNEKMWASIDPSGRYEYEWNRLAGISWVPGSGEPTVTNPYPDQIVATFDGCSSFAQKHVRYVLAQDVDLPASCLTLEKQLDLPGGAVDLYRVGAAG